jgi:glycosyltransferase involved in cell wall biosynthesis
MDAWVNREKLICGFEEPTDLIYLNAEVGSVFEAQVIGLLQFFEQKKCFRSISLLCGVASEAEKLRVKLACKGLSIRLVFFKRKPNYYFFHIFQQVEIARALNRLPQFKKTPVVHIRSELLAFHARLPLLKKLGSLSSVLVDIRGAGWEELVEFQPMSNLMRRLKRKNFVKAFSMLSTFGAVSVVSEALRLYVLKRSNLEDSKLYIAPCLVPVSFTFSLEQRKKIRHELGLSDSEPLIVFSSGGTAQWQQSDVLTQIASEKWKVLNLSQFKVLHSGVINRFVPYSDVPKYLSAADAAVVFRSASIVNRVACPVKFGEYLCMGLPVISDGNVDLIKELILSEGCGILINDVKSIQSIEEFSSFSRKRLTLADLGREVFGVDEVSLKYLEIYKRIYER